MNYTVKVISVDEFKALVIKYLLHEWDRYEKKDIIETLLDDGFMKFDKQDIGSFMKSMQCKVWMSPVAVDIDDSMFYWLVCGSSAILVNKNVVEPKFD
jgi:hypothetical protein